MHAPPTQVEVDLTTEVTPFTIHPAKRKETPVTLCPVCGRIMCDHTPVERGQTNEEMDAPLTPEELRAWETEPADSPKKIAAARKVFEEQKRRRK